MATKTIHHPAYRELVALLRTLREGVGKTQSQLAEELGWPQQRLSAIEAGARRLDVIEFVQLSGALGHRASELIESIAPSLEQTPRR